MYTQTTLTINRTFSILHVINLQRFFFFEKHLQRLSYHAILDSHLDLLLTFFYCLPLRICHFNNCANKL